MRLKIGLAILISLVSITGVAVATTGSIFGILDLPVAAPASKSEMKFDSEYAAANCWAVTGASIGASCASSGDAPGGIPGLPGVPELGLPGLGDLPVPGLGDLPIPSGLPGLPVPMPSACGLPIAGAIPAPTGSLSAVTGAAKTAESTVKGAISGAALPELPMPIPVSVPNVLDTVTKELGCATTSSAPVSAPQVCDVTVPGLPVGLPVPVPAEAGALLGTATKDVKNLTGQSLPAIGGTGVSAGCSADASKLPSPTSLVPSNLVPSPTSVTKGVKVPQPNSLVPGLPTLPNVDKTLGGLPLPGISSVTGTVTDVLSVVGAPTCSANASGGLLSGVLGSITGSASASC